LLSEVPELYQPRADLHRDSLAITEPSAKPAARHVAWDWARLRTRCYREAARVLPRADAEEAVQEAMVRAWLGRSRCRSPDEPLPWLLEITRNEARRLARRESQRSGLELFDSAPFEDERLAGAAARLTVEQALLRLAERDRRLLRLRYSEDLTQVEVARLLGVPEGTVKVRLHRARRRLRRLLEDGA
jgi:RNA polymerase sigma-70 factor, ECF subfamily